MVLEEFVPLVEIGKPVWAKRSVSNGGSLAVGTVQARGPVLIFRPSAACTFRDGSKRFVLLHFHPSLR